MNNPYQQTVSRFLKTTLWLLCLLTISQLAYAQSPVRYVIKGSVVDNAGQPLPGATLLLAGTTIGTNSDASGNYTLGATAKPGPATVVVSAIGYETVRQPISLGSAEAVTVNVSLTESVNNLNDLVVVGSTIQTSRRELGNAITTIKAQDLVQSGSGGLINSLQGKVPGAQITQNSGDPAGSISIRLRGIKSLSGSSDPLYVIDGVIVSNQSANVSQLAASADGGIGAANPGQNRLADINPNDIETLNVINGAAAAAQYGSRAANGVVLITTKRGKAGTPRITFSTSFNTNELRKGVPVNLVNKTFGNTQQRLYTITAFNTPAAQAGAVALNPATTFAPVFRDGTTNQLASNVVDGVTRYNYFDQIFQTGVGTDNALSISGGTDKTQYVVSFGHLANQGIIKGTDFTRYSLRARVDQRLTDWAKLSAGLSYINSFANEKANGNVFYSPINSINIVNNIYDITQRDGSGNLKAVEGPRVNPLSTIEDMKFTQSINRTISDVQLNLTPFKGLTVDYILGVDTYGQVGQNYIRPYPYVAQASLGANLYPGGFAAVANNAVFQINSDINVGYERLLTSDLKLNAIVGYNYQFFRSDYQTASGQNLSPFIETVRGAASTTVLTGST